MEGLASFVEDEIGDIDDQIYGPEADGSEAL